MGCVPKLISNITSNKLFCITLLYHKLAFRLVSSYEDKILGLSENGEMFGGLYIKTFPQFVNYILNEWKTRNNTNEHWSPYYMHCDYCEIKYDIIGRTESFEDDLAYIAYKKHRTMITPT